MQNFKFQVFLSLAIFSFLFPRHAKCQVDEINVSATFAASIACVTTAGNNINFVVATIGEYAGGLSSPFDYFSNFVVSSSVDFKVELSSTEFVDANGNVLDSRNFGFRISDEGRHRVGQNHLLLSGNQSPSELALLGEDQEIVTATGEGNAGPATANSFKVHFELGTPAVRALSGLATLLDQNIAPSTYRSVVTITASAML